MSTPAAPGVRQLTAYADRIESELRQNILPFWLNHARDRERGGFIGEINDGSGIRKGVPRGALLTCRVLWTFSAAYRRYHDKAYLDMARWAYDDLLARFWDQENGGLYWSITESGQPLDQGKIIYVQSFGIYSLAEYHLATADKEPLERAIELYRTVEQHSHDHKNLGYFEEFSRDWKKSRARGPGTAMGSLGQKSQNVHLHMLEAYTNLLRAWPDAELKANLREIADVLLTRVMDPATRHLRLFLEEDWSPQSDTVSYGHDIEFSWLIDEAADVLQDPALIARAKRDAVAIANVTMKEGLDVDGAILAEGDPSGVTNRSKDWWPQAEGVVGFLNSYQISRDPAYLSASLKNWDFIDQRLVDRKNGDWFIGIAPDGKPSGPMKLGFWKCPYHSGRACMEMVSRLRKLAGTN
ncbi:MAG: AGE family epimerase/isomerase [Opitutus sp.]